MSESIEDSSKQNFEDTDEMLIESSSAKKKEVEYTLSDDDEEDTDDRVNNYQYDDFVVPDDFDDDTEQMDGTDTESKKRRRRKKKDFSLDKEDTDLLEQNLGTSSEGYKRLRKARRSDTEDDDILDDDGELSSSYQRDKKMQSYDDLRLINQIFHNETEGEEGDRFMIDEEADLDEERRSELKGYFEPEEIQARFQTEEDRVIIEKDEPERLQMRFKNRPMPDNPELIEETNWLVEKIMMKNSINSKDTVNLKSKVHKVLEYLRLAGCEIMYIWTHKKHDVTSDKKGDFEKNEYQLKLSDLWYIYDLDLEWMHIYKMRKNIQNLINNLESYFQISKNVKNSFRSCYDMNLLKYYLHYVVYQLKKYVDDQEINKILADDPNDYESKGSKHKKMTKRNYAKAVMKLNLHEVGNQIFITPDQMAENMIVGDQRFRPKIINDTPDKIANEYSNPSYSLISEPVETLTTLCEFTALELYHHPIIKKNLKKMYFDRVMVFTDPTPKGNKEISVYDFYYPIKRIRGKKPVDFNSDLWLIALEAEKKGLIKINFRLPWGDDEDKDEIRSRILDLYTLEIKARGTENELTTINAWNVVREEAISKLLHKFAYPSFKKTIREELRQMSEKFIINECAKKFKKTINVQPYMKTSENGEFESDSRHKVLSCVSEGVSGKCHFVIVDENGELKSSLTLNHIGRHPGNDFSKKNIFNNEREELKKFMYMNYPDLIVVGTNSLGCQQIKIELNNIASDVSEEIQSQFENTTARKPFVMWGKDTVPKAFASSYRAIKQYGELDIRIREALSLARSVQDPLAETLNLWSDRSKENLILNFSYHTMQHMVSSYKLKNELEKIAMEVCNNVGIDINRSLKHRHLSPPLQFISGLGPRKASYLLDRIGHEMGHLRMRRELFQTYLDKTVYINCIGFIKINPDSQYMEEEIGGGVYDALDTTRIHPDFYQMAVKIAKEASDDVNSDKIDAVRSVMADPSKLQELDLEDYAKHLSQRGKTNMMVLIEFIVAELTNPFQDPREEYDTKLRGEELFYKLTKESKFALREESIITVKITRIDQKAVRVITDSGIPGIIMISDLKDKLNDIKEGEIGKYYEVKEYLKAKVRSINYDHVRLRLSTKNEDLINHRDFMKKNRILEKYGLNEQYSFSIDKENDFPSVIIDRLKRPTRYIPRRINHPKFKNISLSAAQDYLSEREVGDFVIRPSSKGLDHLNITWKLSSGNICHLDIKEGMKGPNDIISKHLTLDREIYESLDEIIERYIKSCNNLVAQIREHKKFMDESIEYVKETLLDEKKNDPSLIPYYISFTGEAAQYLILSYIPKHYDIKHEYVKIKPDALLFHDRKFPSIKFLIAWFKNKLKTPEYQKYLDNTNPLFDLNKRRYEEVVKKEERRGRKRRNKDSIKKKRRRKDEDENKKRSRAKSKQEDSEWDATSNGGWNDNYGKSSKAKSNRMLKEVKNENTSRSRSRSQEKREKKEEKKGKKSAVSKHSFTSEFLHNAWGANNHKEETWENLDKDDWGAKSEIKTETDWALTQGGKTKEGGDWENWNDAKSQKTNNDATSNW